MRGIAKAVAQVMKFKHPSPAQYERMSIKAKIGYHTSAAKVFKMYASYFSGKTKDEIMQKYKHHIKRLKSLQKITGGGAS